MSKLRSIQCVAFTVFNLVTLLSITFSASAMASATAITAGMSPEVAAEFTKQMGLQKLALKSSNLSLMTSPYFDLVTAINNKLNDATEDGFNPTYQRRLMTHAESMIEAKDSRFAKCQNEINTFISFGHKAHYFSTGKMKLPKDQIMKGNGVIPYPFTQADKNSGNARPIQIAIELGWEYRGRHEENVETFFNRCLAIPINLYYWEDQFEF